MLKQFIFTRHAHSCNNVKENKVNKFSVGKSIAELSSAGFRTSELDPGISLFGMLSCLKKTSMVQDDRYNSDTVFTSCLVRTWMTAILLYLPKIGDALTLVISPYLKEKTTTDVGSLQLSVLNSLTTRKRYNTTQESPLETSNGIDSNGVNTVDGGNLPKDFIEQLTSLFHFFNYLSVIESTITDEIIKTAIGKLKNKKIILSFIVGDSYEITLTISTYNLNNISFDSWNTNDRTIRIGNVYYIYTKSDSKFRRRSPETEISLQSIKQIEGTPKQLDNDNISKYTQKMLPLITQPVTLPISQSVPTSVPRQSFAGGIDKSNTMENPYFQKDLTKFIEWCMKMKPGIQYYHCVTHSDCMQSFCSRFKFRVENGKENASNYGVFGKVDLPFQLLSSSENKSNQEYNKETFKLKNQNIWDLLFVCDGTTVSNIEGKYGFFQTKQLEKITSACERNCDFGYGIGSQTKIERQTQCTDKIGSTGGKKYRTKQKKQKKRLTKKRY